MYYFNNLLSKEKNQYLVNIKFLILDEKIKDIILNTKNNTNTVLRENLLIAYFLNKLHFSELEGTEQDTLYKINAKSIKYLVKDNIGYLYMEGSFFGLKDEFVESRFNDMLEIARNPKGEIIFLNAEFAKKQDNKNIEVTNRITNDLIYKYEQDFSYEGANSNILIGGTSNSEKSNLINNKFLLLPLFEESNVVKNSKQNIIFDKVISSPDFKEPKNRYYLLDLKLFANESYWFSSFLLYITLDNKGKCIISTDKTNNIVYPVLIKKCKDILESLYKMSGLEKINYLDKFNFNLIK